MDIPTYFTDFMHNIRPSPQEMEVYQRAHRELRELLLADDDLKDLVVITFLQGSYRRATLLRPGPGEHADVDVVVVTRMSGDDTTPDQAIRAFVPFLDRHYPGKYRLQGRSIGITLDGVDLDLVVTSAPSESQQGILQSDGLTDLTLWRTGNNCRRGSLPLWVPANAVDFSCGPRKMKHGGSSLWKSRTVKLGGGSLPIHWSRSVGPTKKTGGPTVISFM